MERRGHGGTLQMQTQTGKEEGKEQAGQIPGSRSEQGMGSSCGQGGVEGGGWQ